MLRTGLLVVAASLVMACGGGSEVSTDRTVMVNVSLQTETGVPLRGIAFEVRGCVDGQEDLRSGVTGASGTCSIPCTVCEDMTTTQVKVWLPRDNGFEDDYAVFLEANASMEQWAFQAMYRVDVPDTGNASIAIVVPSAVTISGRLLDDQGNALQGGVGRVNGLEAVWTEGDGSFLLKGVTKDANAWLNIFVESGQRFKLVHVDGAALSNDLNLGGLTVEQWPEEAELAVEVTGWLGFDVPTMGMPTGPVMVRDDLLVALEGQILESGRVCFMGSQEILSRRVPAGKYYVIPGALHWSDEVSWVLDAIERNDPGLAQLPSVELGVGDSELIHVDYPTVLATIRTLYGPP